MASKYFELAFELSGKLDNSFKSSIKNTSKDIEDLNRKLHELEKGRSQSNKLDEKFSKLRKSIIETNKEYTNAQNEVKILAREMKKADAPSDDLSRNFEKAKENAKKLKENLDKQKTELQNVKSEMEKAGTSTTNFAKDQKTLEDAINKTTKAQEKALEAQKRIKDAEEKVNAAREKTSQARMELIDAAVLTKVLEKPVSIAMNAEETLADINKVADFETEAELQEMQRKIMEMNTKGKIPMSFNELGQIIASGAQSGIDNLELPRFASDSAKMGIAMDIEAEEAGQTMAGWRTAFNMDQNEVTDLADKVNYLGNTTAASAPKISEFVTRVGALGEVGGVQSGEIAAIGATLIGMNIPTEVAATATNKLVSTLNKGASATKSQAKVLKTLGFSATGMAKAMQDDAQGAIIGVLNALEQLPAHKKAAALNDLFGETGSKAVGPLLQNIKALEDNLTKVDETQKIFSGSMDSEFETRISTSANSVQMLKNNMENMGIIVGSVLLPPIVTLSEYGGQLAFGLQELATKYPNVTKGVVMAGTAFLALNVAMKVGRYAGALLGENYSLLRLGLEKVRSGTVKKAIASKAATVAELGQAAASKAAAAGQFLLNNAMYGMPILAIIGLIAALVLNFDKVKEKVNELWGAFSEKFPGIAGFVSSAAETIKNTFGAALDWVSKKLSALGEGFEKIKSKMPSFGKGKNGKEIGGYATGGIVDRPELAWVGEGGISEAIIPLEKTRNSISLWERAGRALGMNESPGIKIASEGKVKSNSSSSASSGGDIIFQFFIDAMGDNESAGSNLKESIIKDIIPVILRALESKNIDTKRVRFE